MARRASEALRWAVQMFGSVVYDRQERAARLLEEALELAHSQRLDPRIASALLNRVYSRPVGDVAEEIGQVQLALDILSENLGLDPYLEAEREFRRVQAIPKEEWQRRHRGKVAEGVAAPTRNYGQNYGHDLEGVEYEPRKAQPRPVDSHQGAVDGNRNLGDVD